LDEGICKREDLIIMGKVWINYRNDPEKACRETLKKLQIDYIDIYMDHWPSGKDYRDTDIVKKKVKELNERHIDIGIDYPIKDKFEMVSIYDFWPKMESLVEKGLARSIGVSNYNIQCLCNLLSFCNIKPIANEIEFHLFYIQKNLKEFCEKQDIAIISYYPMPLGNGAKMVIKDNPNNPEYDIRNDTYIKELAEKKGVTIGQIILKWHNKVGAIPIPSTSKKDKFDENGNLVEKSRTPENLGAIKVNLSDEEVDKLSHRFKQRSLKKMCGCERFFGINVLG
jgi:aldehyde reductase